MDAVDGSYGSKNSGMPQFAVINKTMNHIFLLFIFNFRIVLCFFYFNNNMFLATSNSNYNLLSFSSLNYLCELYSKIHSF